MPLHLYAINYQLQADLPFIWQKDSPCHLLDSLYMRKSPSDNE